MDKCFVKDGCNKPDYICFCVKLRISVCDNHLKHHLDSSPFATHNMQLISKSPISNTKEKILAFINITMNNLFKEKSRLIIEASQKIKDIEINLKKNICDIDKNVSKCLECYKEINEACIISKYENLSDNYLLNNENEGIYMMLRSVFNQPYQQLFKASKHELQSKFKNIYINYEKYLDKEISYAKRSIDSADKLLQTMNKSYINKLIPDRVYQVGKKVDKSYFSAQKEFQSIQNLFSHNEIVKFIYRYNKDFENQFKYIQKNFKILSKKYYYLKKDIDNYDINCKQNARYLCRFDNSKNNNFTFFDLKLQKEVPVGFRYANEVMKFKCFIPIMDYKIFCCCAPDKNYACIINIYKKSIKEIPLKTIYKYSTGTYYKNQIYLIGGESNNGHLKMVERYNLSSKRLTKLIPLTASWDFCICAFFNSKILISGKAHKRLYSYDIAADTYSEVLKFHGNLNILATKNKRAYLFLKNRSIYECEIENEYFWKKIGICEISGFLEWKIVYYGNFYFQTRDHSNRFYYKFELENKILTKIG